MNVITKQNTVWHEPSVYRKDREKMNGHESFIIWFTGLSGAGKSTIAHALEDRLHKNKIRTFVLDGDNVRRGLCKDLGFSAEGRTENIRRIGEVSLLMMESGIIVLTAFIYPSIKDRKIVRDLVSKGEFIEVYCNAPIEVCESRDVKGVYKKARAGDISHFTGISSEYEKPENPEILLDTVNNTIESSVERIISYLIEKQIIINQK
ncbi:MAG: adenylyl-sulfate kinase [Proteobacteria bacterium]|nr:adenylyl-sulfate kinase [Pseudomonadota bacterium]NOG59053.1 adenylyl-sulfate kinase [Pseudomonadota bacterium]